MTSSFWLKQLGVVVTFNKKGKIKGENSFSGRGWKARDSLQPSRVSDAIKYPQGSVF